MTLETELSKEQLYVGWYAWLNFADDPLYAWTGTHDVTFGASETGDPLMDGQTFLAVGALAQIGKINDTLDGANPISLTLQAVDPSESVYEELIANEKAWQRRRAVLWYAPVTIGQQAIVAPVRVRTGYMDNLRLIHSNERTAYITIDIEGHAALAQQASETRYIEQSEINPNDISQSWIHDLANKEPILGVGQNVASGGGGSGGQNFKQASGTFISKSKF